MSQPVLNLQVQGNWVKVYDEVRTTSVVVDSSFIPIPAFELGVLFESHILAVRCLSDSAKPTWSFAGILSQRFQIGSGGGASALPVVNASSRTARLNKSALVQFQHLTSNYQLVFEPAHWLKDVQLTVWEYRGPVSDTTEEKIDLVLDATDRIEELLASP
ncbi:hypothetical protein [Synechocystis sp. PCC 7509]|uniref:hypothetical protein n=1 Tax=Synechocystis sp. PCC 7509 TaxID=927677 RepID=UPI0002ABA20D|nr:hypothetical protein [Synechocystis sp. PCC 7509]